MTIHIGAGSSPQPPVRGILKPLVGMKEPPQPPAPVGGDASEEAATVVEGGTAKTADPPPASASSARPANPPAQSSPPSPVKARDIAESLLNDDDEKPEAAEMKDEDMFHVFSWMAANSGPPTRSGTSSSSATDDAAQDRLRIILQSADDVLSGKSGDTRFGESRVYRKAKGADRQYVFNLLRAVEAKLKDTRSKAAKDRFADRVDIFNAADIVYRFFFPATYEGPTTRKFWGAILKIIGVSHGMASP